LFHVDLKNKNSVKMTFSGVQGCYMFLFFLETNTFCFMIAGSADL